MMRRAVLAIVVAIPLAACGRLEFDITLDGAADSIGDARDVRPEAGLIAYYPFDESQFRGAVLDVSGHGRDGVCSLIANTCPEPAPGRVGGAGRFDGVGMHARVPFDPAFNTTTAFTLAAWTWLDNVVDQKGFVNKPHDGDPIANAWQLFVIDDYVQSTIFSESLGNTGAQAMITPLVWTHVAGTWDGTVLRLFVDGVERDARTVSDPLFDSNDVWLGCDVDFGQPEDFHAGLLDDVRIYDRALSTAEIAALANP